MVETASTVESSIQVVEIQPEIVKQEVVKKSTVSIEQMLEPENESELFTAVSPVAFFSANLESIENLSKKQALINNENLAKQSRSDREPEIRVGDVDANG